MPMALGHPARLCLAVTQRTCDVVIARTLCRLLLVFQHHSIRYALPEALASVDTAQQAYNSRG